MLSKLFEIYKVLPPEYQARLKHELDVIQNNSKGDFLPYFATLADICLFCENNAIPIGPCRGSAGASLVSYLLGITALDPIRYNLPFSRFLSKERLEKSVPDTDLDIPKSKRHIVTDYIFKKYGDRAALVSAFTTQKLKNSLQDAWRIQIIQPTKFEIQQIAKTNMAKAESIESQLKLQTQHFDSVRKTLGSGPPGYSDNEWLDGYEEDGAHVPGLLDTNDSFVKFIKQFPKVYETARELLGIPRNLTIHAAGIVIANIPLFEFCPVMKVDGLNVIAYDKKVIAKLGLVKNDFLGLTTLDFINDAFELIGDKELIKQKWDLPEDPEVYSKFTDNKCISVFQWDTIGGSRYAKKLQPKCKEDIFAGVALNRPGAMDGQVMMDDGTEKSAADVYILRKNGTLPVKYLHEDLKPILENTQGIFVYQESVMKAIQDLLGFTEAESDQIRGAISDKNPKGFDSIKERLHKLKERNWSDAQISTFFDQLIAFSRYSFNLSHSAGYGLISYTTAYLKSKFPLEWWSAVLSNSEPNEILEKIWPEVSHLIELPDVNLSNNKFAINNGKLIPPLRLIANVGPKAVDDIASKVPYTSIQDFVDRIDGRATNKRCIINLIHAGAMDCLFPGIQTQKEKIKQYLDTRKESQKVKDETYAEYANLNAVQEYLMAKQAFPVKIAKLSDAVKNTPSIKLPLVDMSHQICGEEMILPTLRGTEPLIDGATFDKISKNIQKHDSKNVDVCIFGYVMAVRKFGYFSKKLNIDKEAMEVLLDLDGTMLKVVCWPRSADYAPKIASHIKESVAYMFKIRISQDPDWPYGISGLEEIL